MKIKIIVHEAEEGGFWAEVPAIPGCATQGETMDELVRNVHDAIEGCSICRAKTRRQGSHFGNRQPGLSRLTHAFLPTDVDARDTSASTRVFDALLPAHAGEFARAKAS